MTDPTPAPAANPDQSPETLAAALQETGYIAGDDLAMALWLAVALGRPLLLEGDAGVGKTAVAGALATALGTRVIRLQCYEGLDAATTLYEWNYQRQILSIRAHEHDRAPDGTAITGDTLERHIFSEDYLLQRPILQAIRAPAPVVLLIDEIDRAPLKTARPCAGAVIL